MDDQNQPAPKRIGPRGFLIGCTGAIVVLVLLVVCGIWLYQWRTARQVEQELAEIRSRGEPASAEELEAMYVLPEDAIDTTSLWMSACAPFDSPQFSQDAGSLPVVGTGESPIPPPGEDWAEMAQVEALLAKYQQQMDLLHEASSKGGAARYPTKFEDGFAMLLPHAQQLRHAARMLSLEAQVRAHRGDAQGVTESVIAIQRAGESLREEPLLISQLVRIAIGGTAKDIVCKTLPRVEFTDNQLQQLSDAFAQPDYVAGYRRSLLGERMSAIIGLDNPESLKEVDGTNVPVAGFLMNSWKLHYLKTMEEPIAISKKTLPQITAEMVDFDERLRQAVEANRPSGLLTAMLAPAVEACVAATARAEATGDGVATAIVIERFRRQNGRLPEALAELVPEFIPAVPADPYDGQPLRYLVGKRKVRIYSIGQNLKDDGGNTEQNEDHGVEVEWPSPQ